MSLPIHSPLQPWNFVQQQRLVPGCNLTLGVPLTDATGAPFLAKDIGEIWFGMVDQSGANYIFQRHLTDGGITIDDTVSPALAIIDVPYDKTRDVVPGSYPFTIAMQVQQTVSPLAAGVIDVMKSTIKWV